MRKDIDAIKELLDDFPVQMEWHDTEELASYLVGHGVTVNNRYGYWIPYLDGESIMPERYYQCSVCGRRGYMTTPMYCVCGSKNVIKE